VADEFPADGTGLERYAARFRAAEINSTFYRPHHARTFERWAAAVPARFRFSAKVPKAITHDARLQGTGDALTAFFDSLAGLGPKLGGVLVQLPPSLAFDARVAGRFFAMLRRRSATRVACEPRHASWFTPAADAVLVRHAIARAASDPARLPAAAHAGGAGVAARWNAVTPPKASARPARTAANMVGGKGTPALSRSGRKSWIRYMKTIAGRAEVGGVCGERCVRTMQAGGRPPPRSRASALATSRHGPAPPPTSFAAVRPEGRAALPPQVPRHAAAQPRQLACARQNSTLRR
jgi:hypothetical protein